MTRTDVINPEIFRVFGMPEAYSGFGVLETRNMALHGASRLVAIPFSGE